MSSSTDYLFYTNSEFEPPDIAGYPTQEWLLTVSQKQFSQGQYTIHFSNATVAEFIHSTSPDYIFADDSLESINSSQRASLRMPIASGWDTSTQCVTLEIDERVQVDKPVKNTQVRIISRGTHPVFIYEPATTTTALTRAGVQRELEIITQGDWFISQASVPPQMLLMQSSANTLNWVSATDILQQNSIEGLNGKPITVTNAETTTEHVSINFEEVEFDTEGIDTLVTDFFLYQSNGIAFNFHIPGGGAPLDAIQPKIKLNWSDFNESTQTEIIII